MINPHINKDGDKFWFNYNGNFHRLDGPAIEYADGEKCWWINGKLHREDGPAIEYLGGYKEWYYNGDQIICYSQEEFERIIKLRIFW